MHRTPRIFDTITVVWTGNPVLPVSFNEGSSLVISVNEALIDASSLIADIHRRIPTQNADAIAYELFAVATAHCAIEIGNRVPAELAEIVLQSCVQHGVPLGDTYRVDNDGRFGYCQRIYIGSRKPSGVRIEASTVSGILKNLKEVQMDPKTLAAELLTFAGRDDAERLVTELIQKTPTDLRVAVIREFFHLWRNTPPSKRKRGVNEIRRIVQRDFSDYWELLGLPQ